MISTTTSTPRRQRGIALVAALLILLVITILGMAMFRSYGMQQRIGGNTRDKSRSFHAAMTGQNYAEWYLTGSNGTNAVAVANCTTPLPAANASSPMVCSNVIPTTVSQPDTWGGGFTYNPGGNMCTATGNQGCYAQLPQFYISNLGPPAPSPIGMTKVMFQIDAAGWGGTPQAVSVVESGYTVTSVSTMNQPSSSGVVTKTVFLGSQQ